jgi:prepilin-type N-terminal cleavage/methylation domain-containing protein
MKIRNSKSAFTLIELLVVIAIIGLLATIAVPILGNAQRKGKMTAALGKARGIGQAMIAYSVQNGSFPNSAWVDPSTATTDTSTGTAQTVTQYSKTCFKIASLMTSKCSSWLAPPTARSSPVLVTLMHGN